MQYKDFSNIDMRLGKIIEVEDFARARVPTYKVKIDFGGEIGIKNSSVQAKTVYKENVLLGMQVIGVVNLPEKNIAGFMSQVLILGVKMDDGSLLLLTPSRTPAKIGSKVF